MPKRVRWERAAGVLVFTAGVIGCTSAPNRTAVKTPPAPVAPPPSSIEARAAATDHFYRGKAFALSGDASCARLEFEEALETFRKNAIPRDRDDLAFAGELYESVRLYRALTDGRNEAEERPPVENAKDTLIASAPAPKAEEVETAKRELAATTEATYDIPVVVNDAVLRAVAYFQFRTPSAFAAALQRSGRYLPLMRGILKEQGLPQDLVFVAMVESAFKSGAHSRKAAHGFWQFIDGTGRRYGLKKSRFLDERSDPVKSTRAAAAYFKDLYEMFGDWYLAMAAYDSGEGKILRGLQRTGARDYWDLSQGSFLRRETKDYVPFILAAALISKNPARFGFDVVPDTPLEFDTVEVKRPVNLDTLAEKAGIAAEDLRLLNGELKGRTTPQGVHAYSLRVPVGTAERVASFLPGLPTAPEIEERRITVRKGDTVAKVAARNKISIAELCDWNDISRDTRLLRGTFLVIPVRGKVRLTRQPVAVLAQNDAAPAKPLRRGEIRALPTPEAAVTSVDDIGRPRAPQAPAPRPLPDHVDIPAEGFETVPARTVSVAKAPSVKTPETTTAATYTVQKGDTLYSIATQHGTTVDALRRLNRMGRRALLRAGQRITVLAAAN